MGSPTDDLSRVIDGRGLAFGAGYLGMGAESGKECVPRWKTQVLIRAGGAGVNKTVICSVITDAIGRTARNSPPPDRSY